MTESKVDFLINENKETNEHLSEYLSKILTVTLWKIKLF